MKGGTLRIAKKYARALFDLCAEDALEEMSTLVAAFAKLWESHTELRTALLNPGTPQKDRLAALEAVAEAVAPGNRNFSRFFSVLLRNKRIACVPQVSVQFAELVDQARRITNVEVTSAFELSAEERADIERRVQEQRNGKVRMIWKVDRAMLGGLTFKVGDRLLDASVKGALQRARAQIAA